MATINNIISFLTSTPESVVDTTGVRWYLSTVSPVNLLIKPMMIYDPTSMHFSQPKYKCFLVPWSSANKISCPLNEPATPINNANPAIMYSFWFHPCWTWDHSLIKLRAYNRTGMLRHELILVNFPTLFRHPRDKFSNYYDLVRGLDRLPAWLSFKIHLEFITSSTDAP